MSEAILLDINMSQNSRYRHAWKKRLREEKKGDYISFSDAGKKRIEN